MKKQEGFTLIELVIYIAIIITIIAIGNSTIRSVIKFNKHQSNISRGQMSINLVNNYIIKDIQKSISIKEKSSSSGNGKSYIYEIITNGFNESGLYISEINYEVCMNDGEYDVIRNTYHDGKLLSSIEIVNKQKNKKSNNKPLRIENKKDTMYQVEIDYYEGVYEKSYSTLVNSRIIINDKEGEVEPPGFSKFNHIGFWCKNTQQTPINNIGTWINDNHSQGTQKPESDGKHQISANLRPGNSGNPNENAQIDDVVTNGDKGNIDVDKISIYVSPYTKVDEFKIQSDSGNVDIKVNGVEYGGTLYGGNDGVWYDCIITPQDKKINKFSITSGILSINKEKVDKGYLWMIYGSME